MEKRLQLAARDAVVIDATAVAVFFATVEAVVAGFRAAFLAASANRSMRRVWLRNGRGLVAGLTLQLAADIVGTSIAPSREEIGKLGAIAPIRTLLDIFLAPDLAELHDGGADTGLAAAGLR
jgi:uncharacterized membrane protein